MFHQPALTTLILLDPAAPVPFAPLFFFATWTGSMPRRMMSCSRPRSEGPSESVLQHFLKGPFFFCWRISSELLPTSGSGQTRCTVHSQKHSVQGDLNENVAKQMLTCCSSVTVAVTDFSFNAKAVKRQSDVFLCYEWLSNAERQHLWSIIPKISERIWPLG